MFIVAPGARGFYLTLCCGILVVGCGPTHTPNPGVQSRSSGQEPAVAVDDTSRSRLVEGWGDTGAIEGTVRFHGKVIPTSTLIPVGADRACCGPEQSKEDCVIDADSRGIRYVIVTLKGDRTRPKSNMKPGYLLLDNKACRFEPHAAVLTLGSTIEMRNSDKINHTVHAYFAGSFNYLLLPRDALAVPLKHVVRTPGLMMVRCDIHGWMNAFIQVDAHPFHAVTDSLGDFAIEEIPAGTYTLSAWHERFGKQTTEISVEKGARTKIELKYWE